MANTVYKLSTGEPVLTQSPLAFTSWDKATEFEDEETVAEELSQTEGESFRVGRPDKPPHT